MKRRPFDLPFDDTRPPNLKLGFRLFEVLRRVAHRVLIWQERSAQRRALAKLEDRLLKDIGLTRAEAAVEVRRPFWLG